MRKCNTQKWQRQYKDNETDVSSPSIAVRKGLCRWYDFMVLIWPSSTHFDSPTFPYYFTSTSIISSGLIYDWICGKRWSVTKLFVSKGQTLHARGLFCHDNVEALKCVFFFHHKTIPNRCKLFNFYPSFWNKNKHTPKIKVSYVHYNCLNCF